MVMHDNKSPYESCEPLHIKLHKLRHHFRRHHPDHFHKHYRYFRFLRPTILLFNLFILYLLFQWVGLKGIGIFFACLIGLKELLQFFFFVRLENRILKPIEKLRQGVDEIAKGNYAIALENDTPNDLSLLIASFNEMAKTLHENEKMQLEYEQNRKTLLANISHDLKTPITAIQGYIEALLDKSIHSSENQERYLKIIHHNTVYINKLIDDLFLFSKLDIQKLEFHFETVPFSKFMNDIMEEYQLEFAEKKIRFQYIGLETNKFVSLDRKRFHQALNNIITNAIKYGPEHDLFIQVRIYEQNDHICLAIKDNGPGIPKDKLPFIFGRFFRVDSERTKDLSSTGLGLAIAKELIEAHGGKIAVSSIENEGACFTIMLPLLLESKQEC